MPLTHHARLRAAQRGISPRDIDLVLAHGSCTHRRGADHYILGWREVERASQLGLDLHALEGYHVVATRDGVILTVYRQTRQRHARPRRPTLETSRTRTCFKAGSDALLKRLERLACQYAPWR